MTSLMPKLTTVMTLVMLLSLFGLLQQCFTQDPCSSHKTLPRAAYRGGQCMFNEDKPLCDKDLPEGWYRANLTERDLLIQTNAADPLTCGTRFPFWMNGLLPTMADGEVSRSMCQTVLDSTCQKSTNITVKNCGAFYVYKLHPTTHCDEGYCFGENDPCPPFDPCDFYEHTEFTFDDNMPAICSQAERCDSFDESAWFQFSGKEFLQIINQSSANIDSSQCIADTYALIGGETQLQNGSVAHTLCLQDENTACMKVEMLSKQCRGFIYDYQVYKLPRELQSTCNKICTDLGSIPKKWFSCHDVHISTQSSSTTMRTSMSTTGDNSDSGSSPDYIAPKPHVTHDISTTAVNEFVRTRVYFVCNFNKSPTEKLLYQVSWYNNDVVQYLTPYKENSDAPELYLTEQLFVANGFQMGNDIACSVRAYTVEQGPPGKASPISDSQFVGIKIQTDPVTFARGDSSVIKGTLTVPVGCEGFEVCRMRLATYTIDECTEVVVQADTCGIEFDSTQTEITIPITNGETGKYLTQTSSYKVYLKTDDTRENEIWKNYHLPPIQVTVTPNLKKDVNEGATCYARTDPHMRTYGGRRYDNHKDGVFTVYKNENFQAEIQIQHQICSSGFAMCPCGIAVRSRNDRYIISVCDGTMTVGYEECGDHALEVHSNDIYSYKLILPYGTNVEASIHDVWWYNVNNNDRAMNIIIKPSSHDLNGAAKGLCGIYDNNNCLNDFHNKHGDKIDGNDHCGRTLYHNNQPEAFINAWKVEHKSENLFSNKYEMIIDETAGYHVCNCPDKPNNNPSASIPTGHIPCNPNTAAACLSGKPVGKHSCSYLSRRRRSVQAKPKIPVVKIPELVEKGHLQKRATVAQNWTEAMARDYCSNYMDESPIFSLCDSVPHARPDEALEECVMDIMITNGPEWASLSMENMRIACLAELERNSTLSESADNEPSIAEIIQDKACSNNCSGVGLCIKGQCECDQGYGASDCSLDLSEPPVLSGLLDDGLCDERQLACDHVYVFGHIFTDGGSLMCRLKEFTVTVDGERRNGTTSHLPGEFETLIEVMCPIHQIRQKRSISENPEEEFVFGYSVSVSNDGQTYQEGHDLFVYNSECQLAETNGEQVHFRLKDGYCFIENNCVISGVRNSQDNCSVCDTEQSTSSWTTDITINECRDNVAQPTDTVPEDNVPEDNVSEKYEADKSATSYLWVIGVVAGVVAGTIVAAIVILKLVMKRSKRIGDSTMLESYKANIEHQKHAEKDVTS